MIGLLKKFGQIVLKGATVATGLQPLLGKDTRAAIAAGTVADTLGQIASVVGLIEASGQAISAPGPQKLTMATPHVTQIVLSSLVAGKKVKNHEKFAQGVKMLTTGVVEILNSLDEDGAKEENP